MWCVRLPVSGRPWVLGACAEVLKKCMERGFLEHACFVGVVGFIDVTGVLCGWVHGIFECAIGVCKCIGSVLHVLCVGVLKGVELCVLELLGGVVYPCV